MNSQESSPINNPDNRKVPGIGSTIETITQDICDCLSEESRKTLQEKTETFAELLGKLQIEIQRIRRETNYPYEFEDYITKLAQNERVLGKVFEEKVLGDEKIKEIYEMLLGSVEEETTREILKQKLWQGYFEDLVYECMDKKEHEIFQSKHEFSGTDFSEMNLDTLQTIFENSRLVKSIDLRETHWELLDEDRLRIIFENLKNVKVVDLSQSNIAGIDEKKLQIIFENLANVLAFDFSWVNLGGCSHEQLQIIFQNLHQLKVVNLKNIKFANFDEKKLQIIFGSLTNLKNIIIGNNSFQELDDQRLEMIFQSFENHEQIYFSGVPFDTLDENKIRIMFRPLKHLKRITFRYCYLGKLDMQKLQIMFEYLSDVEEIVLGNELSFFVKQIPFLFPGLKAKIL